MEKRARVILLKERKKETNLQTQTQTEPQPDAYEAVSGDTTTARDPTEESESRSKRTRVSHFG
jgi:hypothetical protein